MATHYLSVNAGQKCGPGDNSAVVHATSLPTADCIVTLGASLAIGSLSKHTAIRHLQAIINYINSDSTVVPWGSQ